MELVPSVSRSSGLEDGGDALKGHKMQEEYRNFIQGKLERYWTQYPLDAHVTISENPEQRNIQSNILILLRKLREGLLASKRVDDFSLEVYETSLHLSVLFQVPAQTTSILAQLLPEGSGSRGFYDTYSGAVDPRADLSMSTPVATSAAKDSRRSDPRSNTRGLYLPPHARRGRGLPASPVTGNPRAEESHSISAPNAIPPTFLLTWLQSLLHTLLQSHTSRSAYYNRLEAYQRFPNTGDATRWLKSILAALNSHNYIRFERLTRSSEVEAIFRVLSRAIPDLLATRYTDIGCFALKRLVSDLRTKSRDTAWAVLGTAYRELDISQSADWVLRVLMIRPDVGFVDMPGGAMASVQNWLGERPASEVRRKEGTAVSDGRWILSRRK